jgi:single-strand DNA-binding protein
MAFNRVILVGNLVADPELKTTPNGTSVTRFRIAVNRNYTRTGEQPKTDFFDIVAWRQTAEFISRFFTKGRPILVSGTLQNNNWVDNNNVKHYSVEVVADEVTFVDRKGDGIPGQAPIGNNIPTYSTPTADSGFEDLSADDELPF